MQNGGHVMGRYKAYSKEFKVKVAKEAMLPENERCEHIIAEKYGIMPWTVRKWKSLYLEYGEIAFSKGFTKIVANNDQTALERENAELREEIEILKKAAAFLANVKRD